MTTNKPTTMIGVFRERGEAERAFVELQRAGFRADQVGFVTRTDRGMASGKDDPLNMERDATPGVAGGALTGALAGGATAATAAVILPAIGPVVAGGILATTMVGVAVGAATGTVLGALANLGLPEDDARYYETLMRSGRAVVIVRDSSRASDAANILHNSGAFDVDTLGADASVESGQILRMSGHDARRTETDTDIADSVAADEIRMEQEAKPKESVVDRDAQDRMAWESDPPHNQADARELDRRRRKAG